MINIHNLRHIVGVLLVSSLCVGSSNAVVYAQNTIPVGEVFTYDIKKFLINVGEATLVFKGDVVLGDREALLITFTAQGFQFYDEENIFVDPETFYPILIKRNLDIFGSKEQIVERYDTTKGKVQIFKSVKGKTTQQVLENGERFDNIYGFIYRQRMNGVFHEDTSWNMHLPTLDVRFELVKKHTIKAAEQKFEAYFMRSKPKRYEVWFDASAQRLPLRIDGALGVGDMSMVLREYGTRERFAVNR